jgi:DNA-binding transcriptional regulator YdaS (Cro superfamily)
VRERLIAGERERERRLDSERCSAIESATRCR